MKKPWIYVDNISPVFETTSGFTSRYLQKENIISNSIPFLKDMIKNERYETTFELISRYLQKED